MTKITIDKMDHQGNGIGYLNGKVTFVRNTLPNEIVEAEVLKETKKYNIAEVKSYEVESKKRLKPFCPYFPFCGGCDLEHMSYEDTIEYKKEKIENIFQKEKIILPKIEIIKNESPTGYRNKLSLKIKDGKIGFYEEASHTLIEIENCCLAKSCINTCLKNIKSLSIKNGQIVIRTNYNNEILLDIKTNEEVDFKPENFSDSKVVGVILNDQTIYGKDFFYERMNGFLFKVSYDSFFQVNPYITEKLFSLVSESINDSNIVFDLYSGVGTLGLIASKNAQKVYSIENIKNAVLNNVENKKLNKVENVYPLLGNVFNVLPKIKDIADTIIIDPPRKGLDNHSIDFIINLKPKKIIYISCNPITLARDLNKFLLKFKIDKFYILDMFSYTHHVECCVSLSLKE